MMAKFCEGDRVFLRPMEMEVGVSRQAFGRDSRWHDECRRAILRGHGQKNGGLKPAWTDEPMAFSLAGSSRQAN